MEGGSIGEYSEDEFGEKEMGLLENGRKKTGIQSDAM